MVLPDEAESWRRLLGVSDDATSLDICRRFELLAVELAPIDLADVPVYCAPTSELPPDFTRASRHCAGWFQTWGHLYLRDHVPSYRGPGLACIVVDVPDDEHADRIARGAQAYYAARGEQVPLAELLGLVRRADAIETICGTLTHELAHGLDSLASGDFAEWGDGMFTPDFGPRLLARTVRHAEQQSEPPPPQVDCHSLRFTRIVAHLDHRLRQAGVVSTALHRSCAGERFGQRVYDECYAALGDEPARCRDKSFAELLSLPMPPAFAACLKP